MTQNLLEIPDLDPPMGDLFSFRKLSECRSVWAERLPEESGAPAKRIIHSRIFKPHGNATVRRIGIRNGRGYHKCGSRQDQDWIVDLRILNLGTESEEWTELLYQRNLPENMEDTTTWFEISPFETRGLILEIRRCGIDDWWTPWNLAEDAFILEGHLDSPPAPRKETLLETGESTLTNLPNGLEAEMINGEVLYRSKFLQVGFVLSRPGLSHLGIDQDGTGNTTTNLLKTGPGYFHQGLFLTLTGKAPFADRAVRYRFQGHTRINHNKITYSAGVPELGLQYELTWTVHIDRLEFQACRLSDREIRAWRSSAWTIALDPTASPAHAIGEMDEQGQTGLLKSPICLHFPNAGSLALSGQDHGRFRCEVYRPRNRIDWEFKLGEKATPLGDWIIPEGEFQSQWLFQVSKPQYNLQESTPASVRKALKRAGHTGLTFRADTGTLSNNGASMHCPISMDTWAAQTVRTGNIIPGLPANLPLRYSLERWLLGGPGYASGNLKVEGSIHPAEDEYLMTGAAALMGLAEFISNEPSTEWLNQFESPIRAKLEEMQARDLDGDGLIESPYRTGISGSGQWSTCWFDVISFGWKDAFTNAILYEALNIFQNAFHNSPLQDWIPGLVSWARKLKASYWDTFYNTPNNRFAGWVCKNGLLHDYAFLPPNGAAVAAGLVSPECGRSILRGLLEEMQHVNLPSPCFGLPGNLHYIPDEDLSDIIQGYPFGYYQNGGRTHAQTRHFLRGLYTAELYEEADSLLQELCLGFADGVAFGGCNSGLDWRYWDNRPCGYEGLLTDQFGLLAVALERYQSRT